VLSWIDSITIFASLALVIFAVTRASQKAATGSEYFLAGRDLRWWFIGMSLFASNISAEHVLGMAGDGYRIGMVAGGYEWMSGWDLIMLAMLFAPLYLREKIYTIPEFLERRFGWPLRAFLSANLLIINVFTKNAVDIWAGSLLFKALFGWNQFLVMIILSAFTALYTMKGGLRAVVYADMVQGTWLILSSAFLTILGLKAVGGWSALVAAVPHSSIQMVKPLTDDFPITGFLIANFLAGMFYWCMDQTNVQRVLGARTLEDGQRGAMFAGFLKLLVPFILVLPGLIARVLYPGLAPRYDLAYPRLVQGLLPVGLRGLVLAGLIAILMSSMSACYNSSATLVVRDFVLRFKPATTERTQVLIGRWVTVLMAVLGVMAAGLVGLSVTIWYYLQFISAYLSVPMAAVILTGLLWKKGNAKGALGGLIVGFSLGIVLFLDQVLHWGLPIVSHPIMHSFMHRTLVVFVVAVVVMVIVSQITSQAADFSKAAVNVFGEFTAPWKGLSDYRSWAVVLFMCTCLLWWSFR
jgi:SSS family solute:Na+ symporter